MKYRNYHKLGNPVPMGNSSGFAAVIVEGNDKLSPVIAVNDTYLVGRRKTHLTGHTAAGTD